MPATRGLLAALACRLRRDEAAIRTFTVVTGFDGFVDEMISVVGERRGVGDWSALPTLAELGRIVAAAAGHNSLREIVVRSQDPGGCAVNLGDGLAALGVALDFFGTIGQPRHPAFDAFAARCHSATAWSRAYGRTLAFEFSDGKFMFSAVSQLAEFTPELVADHLRDGAFAAACRRARLIAFTDWTLYPHMTACWRLLDEQVLARLDRRPWLFLDLVDPSSRAETEIRAMLAAVTHFQRHCDTVLGLNFTEAGVLGRLLGLGDMARDAEGLAERAARLRTALGISQVVIHSAKNNAVADERGTLAEPAGPFCATPRKTTGAGDHFNAGYCLGLMLGLPPSERLALGSAASGHFIRTAESPKLEELASFLEKWGEGKMQERSAQSAVRKSGSPEVRKSCERDG